MNLDKQTQEKIQELQSLEQAFQQILMQKQAFEMELTEAENALSEISNSKEDVFKMIGNIIIKTDKESLKKELTKKKELFSLRLKSINSQEKSISEKIDPLREEIMKKIK